MASEPTRNRISVGPWGPSPHGDVEVYSIQHDAAVALRYAYDHGVNFGSRRPTEESFAAARIVKDALYLALSSRDERIAVIVRDFLAAYDALKLSDTFDRRLSGNIADFDARLAALRTIPATTSPLDTPVCPEAGAPMPPRDTSAAVLPPDTPSAGAPA